MERKYDDKGRTPNTIAHKSSL